MSSRTLSINRSQDYLRCAGDVHCGAASGPTQNRGSESCDLECAANSGRTPRLTGNLDRCNFNSPGARRVVAITGERVGAPSASTLRGKTRLRGADENLRFTERFKRVAANTIFYRFTIDDYALTDNEA